MTGHNKSSPLYSSDCYGRVTLINQDILLPICLIRALFFLFLGFATCLAKHGKENLFTKVQTLNINFIRQSPKHKNSIPEIILNIIYFFLQKHNTKVSTIPIICKFIIPTLKNINKINSFGFSSFFRNSNFVLFLLFLGYSYATTLKLEIQSFKKT